MRGKNIGPTLSRKLALVGVFTLEDLDRIGPPEVYKELVKREGGHHLPVCYYLYSLAGAISNRDWRELSDDEKFRLRRDAGL